jgi:hypothetical protein
MWSGAVNDWMLGVPVASIVFFATLARSRARAALLGRKPDPAKWSERTAKFLLYGFCIVLFLTAGGIASWNCPHGTAIGIGHLGIAHSAVGGPCRNRLPHLKSWHLGGNWYVWHAWRFRR